MDGIFHFSNNRAFLINWLSNNVHNSAKCLWSYGNFNWCTRIWYILSSN